MMTLRSVAAVVAVVATLNSIGNKAGATTRSSTPANAFGATYSQALHPDLAARYQCDADANVPTTGANRASRYLGSGVVSIYQCPSYRPVLRCTWWGDCYCSPF